MTVAGDLLVRDAAARLPFGAHRTNRFSHAFFFNDTATTEIYTLSLHDALPIHGAGVLSLVPRIENKGVAALARGEERLGVRRSEEHTSELQSLTNLVCRLLLEKKKNVGLHVLRDKKNKKKADREE